MLPDKNYPNRPKEVWTQGEAEDTRYYIPIYDYPNDRTTSEMIADRSGNVDHDLQRPTRGREGRNGRKENVGLEAVRAAFDVPNLRGGR